MNAGGAPPPPPPPPIPGIIPASRLPSEIPSREPNMNPPPAALASAMMKDRKPFTYTPGGLDLSEISNQPNQNGNGVDQADFGPPIQSRSFRVLQTVLDHQDTADAPSSGVPLKVEVPVGAPTPYYSQHNGSSRGSFSQQSGPRGSISQISDEKRGSFSQPFYEKRGSFSSQGAGSPRGSISHTINDKRGSVSQPSGVKRGSVPNALETRGPFSKPNGHRGSVGNIRNTFNQENKNNGVVPENDGLQIIQNSVGGVSRIILGQNGGSEPSSPDTKELSNIFKNQVRISANTDETRTRGGHFTAKNVGSGKKMGSDDEIINYMQATVPPQAHSSVSHGGPHQSHQPAYNQSHYQPQHISQQAKSASDSQYQRQPQHPTSGMQYTQNSIMPKSKEGPSTSRFFRMLQTITDTLPDGAEPQGPVHIPTMRHNVQQPSQHQPQPNQFQQQPVYQQHSGPYQQPGVNNAANVDQSAPEPKKYMGGNIPSRSFRMLQAMTGSDDATEAGEPANTPEPSSQPNDDTQHAANQISSPTGKSSSLNSPSSLSPSLTHAGTHDTSSDSGISSPSKINTYTNVKDSKVYRNVSPKITFNGTKDRVVNSALCNSREPSSPTWKISPQNTAPFNRSHSESDTAVVDGSSDQDSPRLLKIIREESVSPNPQNEQYVERRYEGGHIPSRVFRHLQSEYSGDSNELQEPKSRLNSKSPSPRYEGGSIPPRVLRSLQSEANTSFDSDTTDGENASRASSSMAELDEYYHNGMARTAVTKDTVLKELTSQFDHAGIRKKPKAAPGRVFRYLQAQYDTPEDSADQHNSHVSADTLKPEQEATAGFGYRGPKVPSPSFRFLQNQYSQQEEQPITEEVYIPDAPELKEEPTPYHGCRVPGRTFRSLQDNVATHPSVLKPRK